ncbi:hypothetical protein [Paraglaciecola aestuariivivens]
MQARFENSIQVPGTLVKGHQVASGKAKDSPFPAGTIAMQKPFFKAQGINLDDFFTGTLNINIAPKRFELHNPSFTMKNIKWSEEHAAETFSLSPCQIIVKDKSFAAYLYYPHPETKIGHFKDDSLLEILSHKIDGIAYGDEVLLRLNPNEINLIEGKG